MDKIEIQKRLLKQKPMATITKISLGVAHYTTIILTDVDDLSTMMTLNFEVPISDMGEATFNFREKGQLLFRWIKL